MACSPWSKEHSKNIVGMARGRWSVIRLSAGAGTKGPRLHDWCYLELADLEVEEFYSANHGLWTRGLLIRRNIADGDLAFFTTWCPARTPTETLVAVEGHRWALVHCEARTDREQRRSSAPDDLRAPRRQDETRRTVDLGHSSDGPSSIDLAEIRVTTTESRFAARLNRLLQQNRHETDHQRCRQFGR